MSKAGIAVAQARKLFIFGLGYSATALARVLVGEGWSVAGTTRSADKAAQLAEQDGIRALVDSDDSPASGLEAELATATHMLSSVPPGPDGDPVVARHGDTLRRLAGHVDWAGYLSTTGVYGDRDGGWVDETSALEPTGERGARRVQAEQDWWQLYSGAGLPLHIFRLAGIYGPGRSAIDTVRRGRARRIDKPGQVFSRIHVADIVQVLRASMARPQPGAVFNVCDDQPAPPQDVIAYACELLGVEPPPLVPFEEAELSPMAASFYRDNKRVANQRLKDWLGVQLKHPDYASGLHAQLATERTGA